MTVHAVRCVPAELGRTIREAVKLVQGRPTEAELTEYTARLTEGVRELLSVAEEKCSRMQVGTLEWNRLKGVIVSGKSAISLEPRSGSLARIVQVRTLAHAALLLLTQIEVDQ
jgi:hypothetical protein